MDKALKEKTERMIQRIIEVPEGSMILKEGEVNLDMYKILSGHAEIYAGYGTPAETLLGIIGPGKCFGEFGLLLHKPAIYTVIASSDIGLFRITEGEMGDFVQTNHKNIIDIMRNMANTMMILRTQINLLLQESDNPGDPNVNLTTITDKDKLKEIKKAVTFPSYNWMNSWDAPEEPV